MKIKMYIWDNGAGIYLGTWGGNSEIGRVLGFGGRMKLTATRIIAGVQVKL
jgi:hypothetical protein